MPEAGTDAGGVLRVLSWNLFHGRDAPPDPALHTWRSRFLRVTERNETHLQVNRDLFAEFARVLADAEWDIALLQECPPRWSARLARACGAEHHRCLTARNSLLPLRALAARLNPDLVASNEGGSNTTLVRGRRIAGRRDVVLHDDPPERRTAALTQTSDNLLVVNLHASNDRPRLASAEVLRAAHSATEVAGDRPIVFGGDLNLRPRETPAVFEELVERFRISGPPTGPAAIDHVLARDLVPTAPPRAWPPEGREIPESGRAIRLSDHAPVDAAFRRVASAPEEVR